jgi:hypothetical protein
MGQLSDLLDQLEMYDFKAGKVDLNQSKVMGKLRAMAKEMDDVIAAAKGGKKAPAPTVVVSREEKDRLLEELRTPLPRPSASRENYSFRDANTMLSILYDVPGHKEPLVIGWTTCEKCMMHVKLCRCADGPTEPHSVQQWREASGHVAPPKDLPPTVVDRFDRPAPPAEPDTEALAAEAEAGYDPELITPIPVVRDGLPDDVCKVCGMVVSTENADMNDDGTWTCFADQAQAAERS